MHRRTALAGFAGLVTGGIGIASIPKNARGARANIQGLTIPDVAETVNNSVAGLPIRVTGSYGWNSNVLPSRVVLRLEGKTNTEYTQLAATTPTEIQSQTQTEDFELRGDLLQRLPGIDRSDINPQNRGETKSITVTIRIKVTVHKDGQTLQTATDTQEVTIEVTKQEATADISLSASGEISVQTEA